MTWGRGEGRAPLKRLGSHLWVVVPQPRSHEIAIHREDLRSKLLLGHHGVHTVLQVLQVELHHLTEGLHGYRGERGEPRGAGNRTKPPQATFPRRNGAPRTSAASRGLRWPKAAPRRLLCDPPSLPSHVPVWERVPRGAVKDTGMSGPHPLRFTGRGQAGAWTTHILGTPAQRVAKTVCLVFLRCQGFGDHRNIT